MRFCETNRIGYGMKTVDKMLRRNKMQSRRVKISIRFVWNKKTTSLRLVRFGFRGTGAVNRVSNLLHETACQKAGEDGSIRGQLE
jgi:hypothetical protein